MAENDYVAFAIGSPITPAMVDTVMLLHVRLVALRPSVGAAALPELDSIIASVVELKRLMGITTKPISPA